MIISPKIKGFICLTAHPDGLAADVSRQIGYVTGKPKLKKGRGTLVLGGSAGYGLASAIVSLYGADAPVVSLSFDRPASEKRTGTHGYYNLAALKRAALCDGKDFRVLLGDAFSDASKRAVVDLARESGLVFDRVVYSIAAPARVDPATGVRRQSVIKPIGAPFRSKTIDVWNGAVSNVEVLPAEGDDIENTVSVMGGADWELWISALAEAGLLTGGFSTVAYDYIGPALTHPVYRDGTIGMAKRDLLATSKRLKSYGDAALSVNKGLVTQASSAIPVVPLYISILYAVMKEQGLHEGCIEQIRRLADKEASGERDDEGRFRLDDYEMRPDVQEEVSRRWERISSENLTELADLDGYRSDFYRIFGFGVEGVDYDADVDPNVAIPEAISLL